MLVIVQLMEDMEKATMNLNTNVTGAMKLNATLLLVRYHLIIARQEKKYVYTKECRPVPKTVCDNADQKFLKLSCVP